MGKKSRAKKERQKTEEKKISKGKLESFLIYVVLYGSMLALICPLVFKTQFYFPYVGPKSLYFMGCVQIVFFAWLALAFFYKKYRPKLNYLLIAFGFFLFILILSTLFGVDPSRSFWSKFERMTGLLMWLHLFGWFLALICTLKKLSEWKKVFLFSLIVAGIVSISFLLIEAQSRGFIMEGKDPIFIFARGGGSTLGNSSFLGSYLLFNVFIGIWLFIASKKKWARAISGICAFLSALAIYAAGARAASVAVVGGIVFFGILIWSFYVKKKNIRTAGRVFLGLSIVFVLVVSALVFIPNNPIHSKFIELTTRARFLNWQMALEGFKQRPLLGWGPENYTVIFPQYFHPCLFTPACGSEIWFDRTHNIVLDTLSMTGILGLLSYLGIFFAAFYILIKKKQKYFWSFALLIPLLTSYFVQNLTVFDMVASLMMFVLSLSFISFLQKKEEEQEQVYIIKNKWAILVVILLFSVSFFQFVIQPFRADNLIIQSMQKTPSVSLLEEIKEQQPDKLEGFLTLNSQERIALYKKTLETSSMGKYQARDFFVQHSDTFLRNNAKDFPKEAMKKELDFLTSELKKSITSSPFDYRSMLKLAQLYNLYAFVDPQQLSFAEEYGKKALELSPANQQSYWTLAQTKLFQGEMEQALELTEIAIDLEPNWLQSYQIAYEIAGFGNNTEKQEEIKEKAVEANPEWESAF